MPLSTLRFGETLRKQNEKSGESGGNESGILVEVERGRTMLERLPAIATAEAPWFELAKVEEITGVEEIRGPRHNSRILEYHATTTLQANDDETPWCSSFVNWCIVQCGRTGTNSALARSWAAWETRLEEFRTGCIVVLSRPPNPMSGHVAFFAGHETSSRVLLLGGNQGDQVGYSSYPKSRILSLRWPGVA